MRENITIIAELLEKMFTPASVCLSGAITIGISSYVALFFDTNIFGVSVIFVALVLALMVIDWFLGTYASVRTKGEKFDQKKIGYTIMKFTIFIIWLFAITRVIRELEHYSWAVDLLSFIHIFVIVLIMLREFVSIGDNTKTIWGVKPYIFVLLDSIFSILEKLFKSKLEKKIDNIADDIENLTEETETKNE